MSDSVRPHRRQPTGLPSPWDSPGKNTGVGCHFLLQCMKGKSKSEVAQSCLTLSDSMNCSPPGSSVHGIFQARVLKSGAIASSVSSILTSIKKTQVLHCGNRKDLQNIIYRGEVMDVCLVFDCLPKCTSLTGSSPTDPCTSFVPIM